MNGMKEPTRRLKLGKKPASHNVLLKLEDYVDKVTVLSQLKIPKTFGHGTIYPAKTWGMLGNDEYGDCAWASKAHSAMLRNRVAGRDVSFTTADVLSDYGAATGFNPKDPNTDQGTDMQLGAKYEQDTGIIDSAGKRHKIGAYVAIKPGDIEWHLIALYLFETVELGVVITQSAMDQFNAGKPWSVVKNSPEEGGHDIPLVLRPTTSGLGVVTWGSLQLADDAWFTRYNDESLAIMSEDELNNGVSAEGFNKAQLLADIQQVKGK